LRYDRPVASSRRTIIVVAGARAKPPFRADHVGSFLRPASLAEARRHQQEGKLSREELRRIEDDCIRDVVAMQEKAGLKGITDGDFRRGDWFVDFMFAFDGVTRTGESAPVEFSGGVTFRAPVATVTGRLACPDGGVMVEDFRFLASDYLSGCRRVLERSERRLRRSRGTFCARGLPLPADRRREFDQRG
jgi:hypothetical protein